MSENNNQKKQLIVFYSWQSNLGDLYKNFLENAIEKARLKIKESNEFSITIDQATRDIPGSPDIAEVIFDKVKNADIFIGNITIINKSDNVENRRVPNPNVMIELGYAIANIWWDRIIMPFNTFYGEESDIPFDIRKNRYLTYTFDSSKNEDKSYKNNYLSDLTNKLYEAITLIFDKNPQKVRESEFSPDKIRRERDIKLIKNLLSKIDLVTLDEHINNLHNPPFSIWDGIFVFQHDFHNILISSSFHLYDEKLWGLLNEVDKQWDITLSFGDYYEPQPQSEYNYFKGKGHLPDKVDQDCLKIKMIVKIHLDRSELFTIM